MISRALIVVMLATALVFVPFAGLGGVTQEASMYAEVSHEDTTPTRDGSYPLTLEQEWSNAMLYTDFILESMGLLGGAVLAPILTIYGFAVGVDLLFPIEVGAFGRSALGIGLCAFTGAISLDVLRWSVLAGFFSASWVVYRLQLAALGREQGWTRDPVLVEPEHPDEDVLIKPDVYIVQYLDLLRTAIDDAN